MIDIVNHKIKCGLKIRNPQPPDCKSGGALTRFSLFGFLPAGWCNPNVKGLGFEIQIKIKSNQ